MEYKYLPTNSKAYSPVGVLKSFKEAVQKENGDVQKLFRNKAHSKLVEMWHASYLTIAIYKITGDKFLIIPDENPDFHFIKEDKINTSSQEGFSVEVMSLCNYPTKIFDDDYEKLVKSIWEIKGSTNYDRAELLLVFRQIGKLDVNKLALELKKYGWKFLRIWLEIYDGENNKRVIFQVFSQSDYSGIIGGIELGPKDLPY